ncbi:MAG TPA: hypothetical protein VGF23_07040 [Gaiellaceae bacterium]
MEISHVPCSASYATAGSEARFTVPGGDDSTVRPGNAPVRHVRPASVEVANPMLEAAPSSNRPSWKVATTVEPNAKPSGSTAVSCWLSGLVERSFDRRRETTSQSRVTRSARSAETTSRPGPQAIESRPPNAAWTRSSPPRAEIRSAAFVPRSASARLVPWIVAAVAGAARAATRSNGRAARRIGRAKATGARA